MSQPASMASKVTPGVFVVYKSAAALILSSTLAFGAIAMSKEIKESTIRTPDGDITATTTTVDPFPQGITAVDAGVAAQFRELSAQATAFVATYLPGTRAATLQDCDEAFRLWQADEARRYSEDQVIEILGAYLGEALVRDFDMEWVIVSDQYGVDYAVRSRATEVMSFTFSSVAKRIDKGEHGFMVGVYHTVPHAMENSRKRPASH